MQTHAPVPPELQAWVRDIAVTQDPRVMANTPVVPLITRGLPTRPVAPVHSQVYICAGVIVKIHGEGTDADRLGRRLACIGGADIDRLWIQPLRYALVPAPGNRLATIWPRVTVLSTIDHPPWADTGRLLARLHQMPVLEDPPRVGGHSRLGRAIAYLRGRDDFAWLADLGDALAAELSHERQSTLAHGDFHLGQLGHTPLRRSWKLLDIDNVGVGDPAWDLAAPAGFRAAGLLDEASWQTFLNAYREAGGPAVPADGDPWPALAIPARAALLIDAAQALRAEATEVADGLIDACRRLA